MSSTNKKRITATWRADPEATAIPQPQPITAFFPIPTLPFHAQTERGSDFTVHHICKGCHAPRSVQYHQAHPPTLNSAPITPSLCGRCQKEERVAAPAQVDHSGQSSRSSSTIVSRDQRSRRTRSGAPRSSGRISIHVHQTAHSNGHTSTPQPVVIHTNEEGHTIRHVIHGEGPPAPVTQQPVLEPPPVPAAAPPAPTAPPVPQLNTAQSQPCSSRSSKKIMEHQLFDLASVESPVLVGEIYDTASDLTREWVRIQAEDMQTYNRADEPQRDSVAGAATSGPSVTSQKQAVVNQPPFLKSGNSSKMRRIAREEVAAYRTLERRLDQHPRPFAHTLLTTVDTAATPEVDPVAHSSDALPHADQGTNITTLSIVNRSGPRPEGSSKPASNNSPVISENAVQGKQSIKVTNPMTQPSVPEQSSKQGSKKTSKQSIEQNSKHESKKTSPESAERPGQIVERLSLRQTHRQDASAPQLVVTERKSFETDYTIYPGSSVSQQSVRTYYDPRFGWTTRGLDEIAHAARTSAKEDARLEKTIQASGTRTAAPADNLEIRKEGIPLQTKVTAKALPQQVVYRDHDSGAADRSSRSRPPLPPPAPAANEAPAPPTMPSSPYPYIEKTHATTDSGWIYHQEADPERVRIVRERLITADPIEYNAAEEAPKKGQRVKRYIVEEDGVRLIPDDRGRARIRDIIEKPRDKLRGILRSVSSGPRDEQRSSKGSLSHRVSFSERVDVTMLSPPPSSSDVHSDDRKHHGSRRGEKAHYHRDIRVDTGRSEVDSEKYYGQRARRPDPPERSEASRSNATSSEPIPRGFARALSESPSRERMLHMLEDGTERRRSSPDRRRRPAEPRSDIQATKPAPTPIPAPPEVVVRPDIAGPYAPFSSPTSSTVSHYDRRPVVASGGLSGLPARVKSYGRDTVRAVREMAAASMHAAESSIRPHSPSTAQRSYSYSGASRSDVTAYPDPRDYHAGARDPSPELERRRTVAGDSYGELRRGHDYRDHGRRGGRSDRDDRSDRSDTEWMYERRTRYDARRY